MSLPHSAARAMLWAGPIALVAGFVRLRFWLNMPLGVDAVTALIAVAVGIPGWQAARWLRWRPASAIALAWLVLLVAFAGPLPVLATIAVACGAIGIGSALVPDAITAPFARTALALLAGFALLSGLIGWLLPLPMHGWFESALLVAVVVVRRRAIVAMLVPLPAAWSDAVGAAPRCAAFAWLALGIAGTACWMPTLQFDELAFHLALPSQLQQLGYARLDVGSNVWALAPWSGDVLHALVQLVAGREARGALDALWMLATAALLWELGGGLAVRAPLRWLLVALYASLPLVALLAGGMQTEGPASAVMLAIALLVQRAPDQPDGRVLRLAAVLSGLLLGLKIVHAVAIPPLLLWLLWRWRGRLPWRALPGAVVLALAVGGSSYAYAAWLTGNPVLPLFNDVFRSPDFPAVAFTDPRWLSGMHFSLPWQITFETNRFGEHHPGAAGFAWVALAGAAWLALWNRRTRALAAVGLVVMLVPMWPLQYLRYAHPGLVLLLPALVAAIADVERERIAIALLVALCCLDIAYQPNVIGLLHSGGVARRMTQGETRATDDFAPERRIAAYLRDRPAAGQALFVGSPFVAELAGSAFTTAWYDPVLHRAAASAERDASGTGWRSLYRDIGVRWVEVAPSQMTPALHRSLAGARRVLVVGDAELWQLPDDAIGKRDFASERDRSRPGWWRRTR